MTSSHIPHSHVAEAAHSHITAEAHTPHEVIAKEVIISEASKSLHSHAPHSEITTLLLLGWMLLLGLVLLFLKTSSSTEFLPEYLFE
jgi:HD superfamily phosphohydrolase